MLLSIGSSHPRLRRAFTRLGAALLLLAALGGPVLAESLELPIGPGNERLIESLTGPFPSEGPLGIAAPDTQLKGISVSGLNVDFQLQSGTATSTVRLAFDRSGPSYTVTVIGPPVAGAKALTEAIDRNIRAVTLTLRPAPRKLGTESEAEAKEDKYATRMSRLYKSEPGPDHWFVVAALALYFLGLALGRGALAAWLSSIPRAQWLPIAALTALAGLLVTLLPDTVVYHRGHGWLWVGNVANGQADPHNGSLVYLLSRTLGALAAPGGETAAAASAAYILTIPVAWAWARALFGDDGHGDEASTGAQAPALFFAGLLAAQPALLYLGSSFYGGSLGILLVTLAGFHTTLCVRRGDLRLLLAAAAATLLLLDFRLSGALLAPGIVVIALARRGPASGTPRKFWVATGAAAVLALLLALPRLVAVAGTVGHHGLGLPDASQLSRDQIFSHGHWVATALPWLATLGCVALIAAQVHTRRSALPFRPVPLLVGLAALFLIPMVSGISASVGYLDELRFQAWVVLPVCLAIAAGTAVLQRMAPPKASLAAVVTAGLWLAVTSWGPAHSLAFEHPEQLQLRTWRAALRHLPQGARLAYPAQRGDWYVGLPLAEAAARRPDLVFVPTHGTDRAIPADYWFQPLLCAVPFAQPQDSGQDACRHGVGLHPLHVVRLTMDRTETLEEAGPLPMTATSMYWVSPPLDTAPTWVGLYALNPASRPAPAEKGRPPR